MSESGEGGGLRVAAPAKLNLYLHIPGRRTDGYHDVDSLIAFAEYGDVLAAAPAAGLTLAADGPFAGELPPAGDNLILRAATRLRAATDSKAGGALRLTKNLPVASGIGGGSADAAAALRVLAALWRIDASACDLGALAGTLGADVPVCLAGRTSRVSGIGDEFAATPDLPAVPVVLANPGIALPTADVFRRLAASANYAGPPDEIGWDGVADARELADRLAATRNDLEAPAIALAPQIADALATLGALPGCLLARMSGSGATCFALFADADAAAASAAALARTRPNWWIVATRLRTAPPPIEFMP